MTTRPPCVRCGKPSRHDHHLTGRGQDHHQLDDTLTIPLCFDDHVLIHAELRIDEVDNPLTACSVPEVIERRLRRVAHVMGLFGSSAPAFVWAEHLARSLVLWADELKGFVAHLDTLKIPWRKDQS